MADRKVKIIRQGTPCVKELTKTELDILCKVILDSYFAKVDKEKKENK